MEKNAEEYFEKVYAFVEENPQIKDLFYGSYAVDGPVKMNPKVLFIGINPGHGAKNKDYSFASQKHDEISYLHTYRYHLRDRTKGILKFLGLKNDEIKDLFKNFAVKTNLSYFRTDNDSKLKQLNNRLKEFEPRKKEIEFTKGLISAIKPKVVVLEGKSAWTRLMPSYSKEGTKWKEENYGYYFDEKNLTHFFGYNRRKNPSKSANLSEVSKALKN